MPNGWEAMVSELVNKYIPKSGKHKTDVCKKAISCDKEGIIYA